MEVCWRPTMALSVEGMIPSTFFLMAMVCALSHHLRAVACLMRRRFSALVMATIEQVGPPATAIIGVLGGSPL